jgi:pimeloyl-ACP methyl ester carboxylesterase
MDSDGRVRLLGDARHKQVNPILYRREEAEACWREAKAPVLLILGDESAVLGKQGPDATAAAFREIMPNIEISKVAGAGHLLHIEKPELVAPLVEEFLDAH